MSTTWIVVFGLKGAMRSYVCTHCGAKLDIGTNHTDDCRRICDHCSYKLPGCSFNSLSEDNAFRRIFRYIGPDPTLDDTHPGDVWKALLRSDDFDFAYLERLLASETATDPEGTHQILLAEYDRRIQAAREAGNHDEATKLKALRLGLDYGIFRRTRYNNPSNTRT